MKAFSKFPLVTLLCFTALGTTFSSAALAGITTTAGADAEPSSSIGVTFPPSGDAGGGIGDSANGPHGSANATIRAILSNPQAAAVISNIIANITSTVGAGGSMPGIGGVTITLPSNIASVISQAVSASGGSVAGGDAEGTESAAEGGDSESDDDEESLSFSKQSSEPGIQFVLEQQIADELASFGVEMDVSELAKSMTGLSNSPEKLPAAITAMNDLVMSASRPELEALASSPSITAIRQILNAGNAAL